MLETHSHAEVGPSFPLGVLKEAQLTERAAYVVLHSSQSEAGSKRPIWSAVSPETAFGYMRHE